jgi:hypothetical protein
MENMFPYMVMKWAAPLHQFWTLILINHCVSKSNFYGNPGKNNCTLNFKDACIDNYVQRLLHGGKCTEDRWCILYGLIFLNIIWQELCYSSHTSWEIFIIRYTYGQMQFPSYNLVCKQQIYEPMPTVVMM